MKSFLMLLLCCLSLGTAETFAQSDGDRPERPEPRPEARDRAQRQGPRPTDQRSGPGRFGNFAAVADSLDLTDDQRTAFAALTEQLRTDMRSLRGSSDGDREQTRANGKALMQAYIESVEALLTPDQAERLDALQAGRGDLRADRDGRRDSLRTAMRTRQAELKPMYRELSQLRRERIAPVMAELRSDFDRELTDAERTDIATLREAMQVEREAAKAKRSGSDKEAFKAEMRASRERFAAEHSSEIEAVKAIAERRQMELAEVRERLKTSEQKWSSEADAIRAKYLTAEELARRERLRERMLEGAQRGEEHKNGQTSDQRQRRGAQRGRASTKSAERGHGRDKQADRKQHGAMRFLLMVPGEGEADALDFDGEGDEANLQVYPNPAGRATTVAFDVRSEGPVRVELVDVSGRVVQVLLDERRAAGPIELAVDLPADVGSTLLRITDAKGVRTQVVAKAN